MLHLLSPLVVCGECPESGSSGLGAATSIVRKSPKSDPRQEPGTPADAAS